MHTAAEVRDWRRLSEEEDEEAVNRASGFGRRCFMSNTRTLAGLLLGAVVLVCALLFCSRWFRGEKITDTWYNPPPAGFDSHLHESPVEFSCVSDHRAEAEKRLENNSVASLNEADLSYYGVDAKNLAPGRRPFLVRALTGNKRYGRFYVYHYGGALVIGNLSMGSSMPPVERMPLVVWLAKEPSQVFVSVSVTR